MDFLSAPAETTRLSMGTFSCRSFIELPVSACYPVKGGETVRRAGGTVMLMISFVCLGAACLALPLGAMGIIPSSWVLPVLLIGFGINLTYRKIYASILGIYLRTRNESLLAHLPSLPRRQIRIEDGKTYKTTKLLCEDEGVCILDAQNRRLLIEGNCYRQLIRADDVLSVEAISTFALGGARLTCRMGQHVVDLAIIGSGLGPWGSLVQAFAPSTMGNNIAVTINRTLFGINQPNYQQGVPPQLPIKPNPPPFPAVR